MTPGTSSFILFLAEGASSAFTLATGLLIARRLSLADFGRFNAALAFASILAIVVDSGMGMFAAKDIARGTLEGRRTLQEIFSWRLLMIAAACLGVAAVGNVFWSSGASRSVAVRLLPSVLLLGMTDFFAWIFKGLQRVDRCALLQVGSAALLFLFSAAALFSPRPFTALLYAWGAAGVVTMAAGSYWVSKSLDGLRGGRLSRAFFTRTLPSIYKLGAILILSVVFTRVDILLVARWKGASQAGLFSGAGRIIDGIRLIPMALYGVYLPLFAAAQGEPPLLRFQFKRGLGLILILSAVVVLVGSVWTLPLFTIVLGQKYVAAIPCFRPLLWGCVLMFPNILMFALLYAHNDHRTPLLAIGAAVILEVALDCLWLPRFGIVAAGWARVAAEVVNASVMVTGLKAALA